MSPLLSNVVQLCSVTSCNVLSACVLGGLLPVLCEEGGGAYSVARKLHKELVTGLVMSRYNPATIQFQAACLTIARATPIMYIAGILTLDDCKACITILQGLANKLHKCYVIHLSLGTLLCGLVSECTPNGHQILNDVTTQWMGTVQSQDSAALAGLYVMIGSVGCCDVLFSHMLIRTLLQHHLQGIILTCSTSLFAVLNRSKVQEEIKHTLWLIVQLRAAAMEAITREHNLPKNYSYLLEERALPAVFECLSNYGEQRQSEVVVSGLLRSLGQCSSLPPVDWTSVLLNIVRRMPNMYQSCLQYALKLTNTSKGFHWFIVYCCSPVVLCSLETAIQQMLMSKLHLLVHDMSSPSLGDLLGSWPHVCQQKKELLGSFVEGLRQALQLAEITDTKITLLNHCVWNICRLLQQFPHLLEYAINHKTTVTDITKCILATSTGDPHAAAVTLETEMPNMTVLKSLIYSHLISLVSHTHHNFLHSCLTALPVLTSPSHYILMNLLNSVLHSTSCINKQDLFHFLTHCIKESMQDSYVSKAEAQMMIKIALLGSWGCRNSIDLWLGFLGNSKLTTTDQHLVHTHLNQLISALLMCLATSKSSSTNLKQLLSQWVIEMVMKNAEDAGHPGSYVILVTNGGSALWRVWINFV